jgi:NTP pyrophosphatase (non-canonical NTP hydrolase)
MNGVTIRRAQGLVKDFLDKMGPEWTLIDNRFYIVTHMMEEIGEVARNVTYLELGRRNKNPMKVKRELARELGDVLYHIFKLAIAYDIDLETAFLTRIEELQNRFGSNRK